MYCSVFLCTLLAGARLASTTPKLLTNDVNVGGGGGGSGGVVGTVRVSEESVSMSLWHLIVIALIIAAVPVLAAILAVVVLCCTNKYVHMHSYGYTDIGSSKSSRP